MLEEMLSVEGSADRFLAMLAHVQGRLDEADDHYRRALDLEAAFEAPWLVANTQYWWARTLLARGGAGDSAMARALLTQCRGSCRRMGASTLEGRATSLLEQAG